MKRKKLVQSRTQEEFRSSYTLNGNWDTQAKTRKETIELKLHIVGVVIFKYQHKIRSLSFLYPQQVLTW